MKKIIVFTLLLVIIYRIGSVFVQNNSKYFGGWYTEAYYKNLENAFNHSQYRQKEKPGIIPDETVFSYAAGAYLRGVDPILVNSEHTPLGKYFIALSIYLFKNDSFIVIPFGIITLYSLWLLGYVVLGSKIIAIIPLVLLSFEKIFINQLIFTPLLDIIQLPFVLFALYFFLRGYKKGSFFLTSISIGLVMATKTVVPGILLIACCSIFLALNKLHKNLIFFLMTLPITAMILIFSYIKTFLNGYTFLDFIGFQKWIFLYQQSKLIFPFSYWKLVLFNQWQSWWGEMKILTADDWQITWPIFTLLPFFLILLAGLNIIKLSSKILFLLIWIFIYEIFLSLGVVSSRFLLILLPVQFIVGVYTVNEVYYLVYRSRVRLRRL